MPGKLPRAGSRETRSSALVSKDLPASDTPTFAICGVAGHNRGDDAIAVALAQGLLARRPNAKIRVAINQPGALASISQIETFLCNRKSPKGIIQLASAIARSDLIIVGGGSLIQDKFGGGRIKGVLGYAWTVSMLATLFRKRLVTAPLGVDTLHCERSKRAAAELLDRCAKVSVRDNKSLENAQALPVHSAPQPQRVCDPAFSLAGTPVTQLADDAPFVLAPAFEGEYNELVAEVFRGVVSRLTAVSERPIVLLAMDDRPEEDGGKMRMILDGLSAVERAKVRVEVPSDIDVVITLLRSSAGIVAMRLHAMILGYGFTPIACLSRTTKTEAFMEDYKVPGLLLQQGSDPVSIAEALANQVQSWDTRDAQQMIRADRIRDLDKYFDDVIQELPPRS